MLEIRLLGPLEARDGERDLTPHRQKQRALLAVLALRAGAPVSPDRLVDALWAEAAPKTARHAIENYVSELRKTLGKDLIETRSNGYVLQLDPDRVDASRFERLVAQAHGEEPTARVELLREALSLVRGEPLADLAFEPFAQVEAGRLQELELSAREEHVEAELELGRHAEVVPALEPLVAAHPFRERFRAQLMVALYRSGRQADALVAYQDARRILVEELGIDPTEELQELERAILRQDPSLRPPARPRDTVAVAAEPERPSRPLRKTVTILHAELANSAALAQRLDAEPLRAVLDRYLDVARTAVERHGGVCARLGGDVVQAVFGVPVAHEDDALRAVRAAAELREGIGVLNDGLVPEHAVFLEVRTGLDTGEVLVTPNGDTPATGRAVAGAEQLEREALPGQILLGAQTHELVQGMVEAEEVSTGGYRLVELLPDVHGRALRLDSPMVGRRRQLATLSSAFENAVAERELYLFTVLGEAGVGKSRLVRELVDGLGDVATVLQGRCLPYGEGVTFWPLVEATRHLDLAEITVDGVRGLFERLAREQPLVVVLDDLQWAEASLLDFVEQVVESAQEAPMLIVCIARPELLDGRPTWGGGKRRAGSLVLEALSEAESERLIDNLLGESDLPDPVRDHIVRAGEGNPLFVEELLATLVERNVLQRRAGRWTTTELPTLSVPPTIQALVAARIDRLPDEERTVLELAAVAGKVFDAGVVADLAAGRPDVEATLTALVRRELIRPVPEERQFRFRHQVIRDAAYSSLPLQARAELHERLASRLDRGPEVEEIVGYHLEQARRCRETLGRPRVEPRVSDV
jgi:DNA-binding SARP family transcriptional activator